MRKEQTNVRNDAQKNFTNENITNENIGSEKFVNENLTELVFVMDMSGSMQGLESDTIGGFNSLVEKQKRESGECLVSTVFFNHVSKVLYDRVEIQNIKAMTINDYIPNGSTALIDALSDAIRHISKVHKYIRKEDIPKKTMFVVITDGMENASHRHTLKSLKQLISLKQESGWEFLFIGANIDAIDVAGDFGIPADRAVNYNADKRGTKIVYETLAKAVSSIRFSNDLDEDWSEEINEDYNKRKK